MPETGIRIEGPELKALREALCVAQGAISREYVGEQRDYGQRYAQRLAVLIERIDEARPLGSDGKHGDLHTDLCGCVPEHRFVKGDVVKVVNPKSEFFYEQTGTVIEHIYNDPYHYWVRVDDYFADILPFKDEELEIAND